MSSSRREVLEQSAAWWREHEPARALGALLDAYPAEHWSPVGELLDKVQAELDKPSQPRLPPSVAEARALLRERAVDCEPSAGKPSAPAHLQWLADDLDDLLGVEEDDRLRVAVMGVFSAGKSSLINALLGEPELLPEGMEPKTAVLTEIRYGTRRKVLVVEDGVERPCSWDDRYGLLTAGTERVCVELPHELLRGLTIVDTPGINSEDHFHEDRTLQELGKCDVGVWVFPASKANADKAGLALKLLERSSGKAIGVVNKVDEIRLGRRKNARERWNEELRGVLDDLQRDMGGFVQTWLSTSVLWFREGREDPPHGFGDLQAVFASLQAEKQERKAAARARKEREAQRWVTAARVLGHEEQGVLAEFDRVFERRRDEIQKDWKMESALARRREEALRYPREGDPALDQLFEEIGGADDRESVVQLVSRLDAHSVLLQSGSAGATWRGGLVRMARVAARAKPPRYWSRGSENCSSNPAREFLTSTLMSLDHGWFDDSMSAEWAHPAHLLDRTQARASLPLSGEELCRKVQERRHQALKRLWTSSVALYTDRWAASLVRLADQPLSPSHRAEARNAEQSLRPDSEVAGLFASIASDDPTSLSRLLARLEGEGEELGLCRSVRRALEATEISDPFIEPSERFLQLAKRRGVFARAGGCVMLLLLVFIGVPAFVAGLRSGAEYASEVEVPGAAGLLGGFRQDLARTINGIPQASHVRVIVESSVEQSIRGWRSAADYWVRQSIDEGVPEAGRTVAEPPELEPARIAIRQHRTAEAHSLLDSCLERQPEHTQCAWEKGWAFWQEDDFVSSVRTWEPLQSRPDAPESIGKWLIQARRKAAAE